MAVNIKIILIKYIMFTRLHYTDMYHHRELMFVGYNSLNFE